MSPSQPLPPSHGSPASSSSSGSGASQSPGNPDEAGRPATTSNTSPPSSSSSTKPHHSTVGVFSKRKGVRYRRDGQVLSCRFCEILRLRDEQFLYEDEQVVVFRPLRPIVASHILIVPRAHIRNVTMLASSHEALLRQMKRVAERVLLKNPSLSSSSSSSLSTVHGGDSTGTGAAAVTGSSSLSNHDDSDPLAPTTADRSEDSKHSDESSKCTDDEDSCSPNNNSNIKNNNSRTSSRKLLPALKFAFHVPPFNSIDHVHMHAFRDEPHCMGVFGRIKYRTESWWCRSYDGVLARVSGDFAKEAAPHDDDEEDEPPSLRADSSMKRHAVTANQRC